MTRSRKVPATPAAATGTADRILGAARALFEREGTQAVSMRRIADAIGLTPMAIYRHFPNREALLKRISDDSFDEIARHWLARNQGGDALSPEMRRFIEEAKASGMTRCPIRDIEAQAAKCPVDFKTVTPAQAKAAVEQMLDVGPGGT